MKKIKFSQIQQNSYLFFGLKFIIFLLIIVSLDSLIGSTLRYFYFKQDSGAEYGATYVMEKTKEELLIFGSSRALHHYQPQVFESRLGYTTYNAGRNGNPILYHLAIFKSALLRYKPKQIILDININEFQKMEGTYDVLSTLLPYYKHHPEVRPIINLRSKFEKLKLYSQIYPYNSLIFTIAAGNTEFNKKRKEVSSGYMPLYNTWNKSLGLEKKITAYEVDKIKVEALNSIINECKLNNIGLTLVFSPYYKKFAATNPSILIAKQIAKKNNIRFFDFTNDNRFITKPLLFADYTHLNDAGAKYFTKILIDSLQSSIIQKMN